MREQHVPTDFATRYPLLPPTEEFVQLTKDLIALETYTPDGVRDGMDYLADKVRQLGFEPVLVPTQPLPVLEVTVGDEGPLILWVAHIDTVPPSRDDHCVPDIRDGRLYGLGAVDTKGAIAAALLALPELARLALALGMRFRVVITGDEENPHSRHSIEDYAIQRLVDDPPVFAIAGEPTESQMSYGAMGRLGAVVAVTGKSAHGSRPWLGWDAIQAMAKLVVSLPKLPCTEHRHPLFPGQSPTVTPTTFHGGDAANKVAGYCVIDVDIRTLPGQKPEAILEEIRQEVRNTLGPLPEKVSVTVDAVELYARPIAVDPLDPYVQILTEIVRESLPADMSSTRTQTGASDLSFLPVDITALTRIGLVEWGPAGWHHHEAGEYVVAAGMRQYAAMLVELVNRAGKKHGASLNR